uniref:C3H1-type domain-containing protein n=1 Tax=Sinocyclocheilus rhinocerous TaxID=307959 RepID=A0A673KEJ1_9TELE
MSATGQDRSSRWKDIQKGLQFIQSTLPFPGTQEQYEVFIQSLVRNLFGEANDVFLEGEWTRSVELYTESLNIAEYAESEDIIISQDLKEKLYANRAASYLNIGLHDQALEDSEKALQLNESNYRALYRKARCLKEMGRYQEAYEVVAKCSMAVPQDTHVIEMTQELAGMLGLKIRKAYVRSKVNKLDNWGKSIYMPLCYTVNEMEEVEAKPLVGVISPPVVPVDTNNPEPVPMPIHMPLVNGTRPNDSYAVPDTHLDYDTDIIGDDLDELLDRASPPESSLVSLRRTAFLLLCCLVNLSYLLFQLSNSDMSVPNIPPIGMGFSTSDGTFVQDYPPQQDLAKNPLADTHEFKQACSSCYIKTGPGVLDYAYHPEDHKCKKDLLLGRTKHSELPTWKFIRPRPTKNQYMGPYYICKDVAMGQECQYLGHCTFAYCQEEIDVWTLERKGFICRENLCDPYGSKPKINLTVPKILQEHHGIFMFLCEVCFDHKPRIISKTNKDNPGLCSHPVTKHAFEEKNWSKERRVVLVSSVERKKWTTVRPLPTKKPIPAQFDICLHVAAGKKCQYIGNCTFAHSTEERDLWTFMKDNNIADMEQLYEMWLQSQKPGWSEESSSATRENGKQIHMPTDYAEEVAGNHCWLCGKNCNSDKQWQQHITSEKHKERVFNSEDDQNCWQYRFPTGTFRVCERFLKGTCTEEELCKLAHGDEELKEWKDRREFLLMKLAKARKDHLIAPNDNDFGKYSFLLKDIK